MTSISYDPALTMRQARAAYFAANHFGEDGGYGDAWVDFKLGPLPLPFPNTAGRKRAVAYHDLHHIVTGYDTNALGEFEISAWELGAGCGSFAAAWVINLGGLCAGLIAAPRRTVAAFRRGRRSRSLYGRRLDELLDASVGEVRAMTARSEPSTFATDSVLLGLGALSGAVAASMLLMVMLTLMPVFLVLGAVRRHAAAAS